MISDDYLRGRIHGLTESIVALRRLQMDYAERRQRYRIIEKSINIIKAQIDLLLEYEPTHDHPNRQK